MTSLDDYSRAANLDPGILHTIAKDVSWLRETSVRITPGVEGLTRAQCHEQASYYYGAVAAVLVALRDREIVKPEQLTGHFPPDGIKAPVKTKASAFV